MQLPVRLSNRAMPALSVPTQMKWSGSSGSGHREKSRLAGKVVGSAGSCWKVRQTFFAGSNASRPSMVAIQMLPSGATDHCEMGQYFESRNSTGKEWRPITRMASVSMHTRSTGRFQVFLPPEVTTQICDPRPWNTRLGASSRRSVAWKAPAGSR